MTFEEFFTKKKISLPQLQSGEPSLFTEFKNHYEQMGEKSFDHTKKYWFNQLRRRFPVSADIKVEKVDIANPIAEQTVMDVLTAPATEPTAPATGFRPRFRAAATPPKTEEQTPASQEAKTDPADATPATGFKPRFRAGATKQAEEPSEEVKSDITEGPKAETPAETEIAKPTTSFKPRFKAGVTKPVEETLPETIAEASSEKSVEAEAPKPAVGFNPQFKAGVTKPAEEATSEPIAETPAGEKPVEVGAPKPAVGFKPRFKAGVTKAVEEAASEPIAEAPTEEKPVEAEAPKSAVGFKPRFKAGVTNKLVEATPIAEDKVEEVKPADPIAETTPAQAAESDAEPSGEEKPKPVGFKPRFNAAKMKPKDPGA
ncbi:hypothetical protein [Mucilaginibacter myungsuensis]|uniref:Uncharacterized protein n=1 Tax=Mucilaginibacter myungsuensis TaxID=649104 RepID=A0A929KZC9_9SPHI|nr:hypothetical protein [Mucilaginibacter myungsuensis]MBE9661664.1 hypothetical protein [Mucilaginibacter myungsuensis]MDN3597808.1 hypothetical protein [Mucilaginibacter myungsuensis]